MDVILLERVEKLGQMGDVVVVKPGYARNFLLPRGKALRATANNRARFDHMRTELETTNLKHRAEAEAKQREQEQQKPSEEETTQPAEEEAQEQGAGPVGSGDRKRM